MSMDSALIEVGKKLGWIKRDCREPDKVLANVGSIRKTLLFAGLRYSEENDDEWRYPFQEGDPKSVEEWYTKWRDIIPKQAADELLLLLLLGEEAFV